MVREKNDQYRTGVALTRPEIFTFKLHAVDTRIQYEYEKGATNPLFLDLSEGTDVNVHPIHNMFIPYFLLKKIPLKFYLF